MKWLLREICMATAIGAAVLMIQPSLLDVVIRVWLVVIGVLVSGAILSRAFARIPAEPDGRSTDTGGNLIRPIGEVRRMRDIDQANDILLAVDYQLYPFLRNMLRQIAHHRLSANHNVDLERSPGDAHRLLGDECWEVVHPTSAVAGSSDWGTISTATLTEITRRLEKL